MVLDLGSPHFVKNFTLKKNKQKQNGLLIDGVLRLGLIDPASGMYLLTEMLRHICKSLWIRASPKCCKCKGGSWSRRENPSATARLIAP